MTFKSIDNVTAEDLTRITGKRCIDCVMCMGEGTRNLAGQGVVSCPDCLGNGRVNDIVFNEHKIDLEPNEAWMVADMMQATTYSRAKTMAEVLKYLVKVGLWQYEDARSI